MRYHCNRIIPLDESLTTSSPLARILKHGRPTKFKGSFHDRSKHSEGVSSPQWQEQLVFAIATSVTTHPFSSPAKAQRYTRRSANCVGARVRVTPPHLRIGRATLSFFFLHGFRGAESESGKLPPPAPKSEPSCSAVYAYTV